VAEERVQRRLAAILAADVVGYSRLIEADEEGTRARLRILQTQLINPQIASDGGRIVKTMSDGILVEFPSAVDAVRDALAIQSSIAEHNSELPESQRLMFRVGINVGDVIIEGKKCLRPIARAQTELFSLLCPRSLSGAHTGSRRSLYRRTSQSRPARKLNAQCYEDL
jgi:hypothetical protein